MEVKREADDGFMEEQRFEMVEHVQIKQENYDDTGIIVLEETYINSKSITNQSMNSVDIVKCELVPVNNPKQSIIDEIWNNQQDNDKVGYEICELVSMKQENDTDPQTRNLQQTYASPRSKINQINDDTDIKCDLVPVKPSKRLKIGTFAKGNHVKKWALPGGIFICKLCGNMYTTKFELFHHISSHLTKKQTMSKALEFRSHKTKYLQGKIENKFTNSSKKKLSRNHHSYCHTGVNQFNCIICMESFTEKVYLDEHMRCHTEQTPFRCEICLKTFGDEGKLTNHMRCHTVEKPFNCEICWKAFRERGHLNKHMREHTSDIPLKCEICLQPFRQKGHFNRHIMRSHSDEQPFKCEFCTKSFREKDHWKEHMRSHTEENPFKCDICLHSFRQKADLDRHIRCHTEEQPFKCKICSNSFREENHLNKHMNCHAPDKPFKCEICLKSFKKQGLLNRHMRCHTDRQPFKCDICLISFRYEGTLIHHLRSHSTEKDSNVIVSKETFFK